MSEDFFAPPAFKAADALTQLKRTLRELKPLTERSGTYEAGGRAVVKAALSATGDTIDAQLARRPAASPDWDRSTIRSSADQRKFIDAVRARLARWGDED